jgi:hypothetical protein
MVVVAIAAEIINAGISGGDFIQPFTIAARGGTY